MGLKESRSGNCPVHHPQRMMEEGHRNIIQEHHLGRPFQQLFQGAVRQIQMKKRPKAFPATAGVLGRVPGLHEAHLRMGDKQPPRTEQRDDPRTAEAGLALRGDPLYQGPLESSCVSPSKLTVQIGPPSHPHFHLSLGRNPGQPHSNQGRGGERILQGSPMDVPITGDSVIAWPLRLPHGRESRRSARHRPAWR